MENPEIHPYKYGQLIFDKGAKSNEAKVVFSQMVLEQFDIHMPEK